MSDAHGYMVLDVDPESGGLESLAELEGQYGPRPAGRDDRTRGGQRHIAYGHPADQPLNQVPHAGTCDDCTGTVVWGRLDHDPGCPFGVAMDRRGDADRDWFAAHPDAETFYRDIDRAERLEMRATGILPDVPGRITGRMAVTRLGPGLRLRGALNLRFEPEDES